MKYFGKLVFMSAFCLLVAGLVIITNGNKKISFGTKGLSQVVNEDKNYQVQEPEGYEEEKPALILYSPKDETSVKYKANLEDTLGYLKRNYESLDIARTDSVSYSNYSMVILASQNLEAELKDSAKRLFTYVEQGGRLFWGILQNETESEFQSIYKKMGVMDYGDYEEFQSLTFQEDLLPGMKGETFEEEDFEDVCLFVRLVDDARVYCYTDINNHQIPLIWSYDYGKGRTVCFNSTSIVGDFYRGISAGCINALYDTVMYPVINAKCVFIDDFPSPQYESESDVVRKDYNRSVKEFYRDIWWPDMQKAGNKNHYVYTGLFVSTYNNIVDPEKFVFDETSMEQYYGNSLLRAGHEMGAHGYNHQSLAGEGETPKEMGYRAWKSQDDMAASLKKLVSITEKLFPGTKLMTYVPPSNYLSAEGREAVKEALPDLKVISGVYTNEGEEGVVYSQQFEIADDGVAEFPRITSGMMLSQYDKLEWMSAMGLHGVFSHFIHPDDIFDEERGKGQNWETLLESYETLLTEVNEAAPGIRSLSASDGAEALKVYQEIQPKLMYTDSEVRGSLENFKGEAYFFLRTDKKPVSKNDACVITRLGKDDGDLYYLVKVMQPEFVISLKEG